MACFETLSLIICVSFFIECFSFRFQVDLTRQLIDELSEKYHLDSSDRTLIVTGALARAGKTEEAVVTLLKSDPQDLERVLIATQLYLEKKDLASAIMILEKLPKEDKYRTGKTIWGISFFLAKSFSVSEGNWVAPDGLKVHMVLVLKLIVLMD